MSSPAPEPSPPQDATAAPDGGTAYVVAGAVFPPVTDRPARPAGWWAAVLLLLVVGLCVSGAVTAWHLVTTTVPPR